MQKTIFSIYDKAAEEYANQLLMAKAEAAAVRLFTDLAKDEKTSISQHLADYELHQLGHIHTGTGELIPDHKVVLTGIRLQEILTPRES